MILTDPLNVRATQPKQLNKQGASYSVNHPAAPTLSNPGDYGGLSGLQTLYIIRIDSSCGYACFWGLFGCLAAFWGVFEVAAKVVNLTSSNGVVASADLFVT